MPENFYITTPIYYVNAEPHIGHAYTTIVADVLNRFHKLVGLKTFFLTGTDEHGDKIVTAAENSGQTPKEYVDRISGMFQALWPRLNISNSAFIRTTDAYHQETVRNILSLVKEKDDIYFSEYEGLYCFGCERFYTEKELVDGKCPDHRTEPDVIKEANYFFRMSRYQEWLVEHITKNPDFIRPERYRNEVLSFLSEPLEDLCISRPKSRLTWGITLPFDENFVTYVWFDALINYVSALGYPDGERFNRFWPYAQHTIAKDILKPHGIYWPCMLKSAGIEPYRHLNVHGYWSIDAGKMSKSVGNVVDPLSLVDIYGVDPFRYFVMREMAFGLDSEFSEKALVGRLNADLANDLGNLVSRSLTMVHKYFDGVLPDASPSGEEDEALRKRFIPTSAEKIQEQLGLENQGENCRLEDLKKWGLEKPSHPIRKAPGLFPRIDVKKKEKQAPPAAQKAKPKKEKPKKEKTDTGEPPGLIRFQDFQKLDLRIGVIMAAEEIPGSKKLLKLTVDMGEERTVVAGIKEHYEKEALPGKQVLMAANLEPVKLMGVESQGMLLAAGDKEGLHLMMPDSEATPGAKVK
ncbi:MAG: methionine--tRNA ligase [Desulfobacteraceae bacterium 4572_87]|nr:MAG: methionine--tRNA ligase [Desulfobacteraceae bacterium 4572_87]